MNIGYKTITFSLAAQETIVLPPYKGSTFRGGFGNAFRKIVCALKRTDCSECILREKCVYSYIFETPPPSDSKVMRKYETAPHPFVIEPPPERKRGYIPGNEIIFGLILIGRAIDYLPYFIYAFDELGKMGIGKGRGKYELKKVESRAIKAESEENNKSTKTIENEKPVIPVKTGIQDSAGLTKIIYDSATKTLKSIEPAYLDIDFDDSDSSTFANSNLSLSFLTPTRLVYDGHLTLDLEFHILIRQLLRRISLLSYFHCGGDPSEWDFRGIIEEAKNVRVKERNLKWYDWERYSARQETRMKMGGFVGDLSFEGDLEPFIPLINAGEVLHVGKGTSFGLGKYEII